MITATLDRPTPLELVLDPTETAAAIADLEARLTTQRAPEPMPVRTEVVGLAEAQARAAIFGRMMTARVLGEELSAFQAYSEVIAGIDRMCGSTAEKKNISPMQVYLGMMALVQE